MVNSMFQWLSISLIALLHPFYVSVIDINHNTKEETVEMSIRIFTQDLEETLQKYSAAKIDMVHPANKAVLDKQINDYIKQKLQLKMNSQTVTMQYVGYEIQLESVWIYFEVPKIKQLKKLDVNCTILYDFQRIKL